MGAGDSEGHSKGRVMGLPKWQSDLSAHGAHSRAAIHHWNRCSPGKMLLAENWCIGEKGEEEVVTNLYQRALFSCQLSWKTRWGSTTSAPNAARTEAPDNSFKPFRGRILCEVP